MPEATIASFILRFTQEHTPDAPASHTSWRGVIRHIQTKEEIRFTRMESALDFMARYVDVTAGDTFEEKVE